MHVLRVARPHGSSRMPSGARRTSIAVVVAIIIISRYHYYQYYYHFHDC